MRIPATELLKSVPEFFGIRLNEQPRFDVLEKDGDVEVRAYAPIRVARTTVPGDFEASRQAAFERLARYIFGGNVDEEKIPMTAPVLQEREGDGWRMTFALPKEFLGRPAPSPESSEVDLALQPARTFAVLGYGGNNTEASMAKAAEELGRWLESHPRYQALSPIFWAQYDAPFVLPFLKKNEAMVHVRAVQ